MERLGHDGDGCIPTERGTVFVRGALPGEEIEIGPLRREGSITRADLVRIVRRAPGRIDSLCPVAARCGGCPLMSASFELEREEKAALVARAFSAAGLAPEIDTIAPEPFLGYRVRARLAWKTHRGKRSLGYRAGGSDDVVDVEHCVVLDPRLDAALGALRAGLGDVLVGAGEIHLGLGARGAVARVTSSAPQPQSMYAALLRLLERGALGGAALEVGGATVATRYGDAAEVAHDVDGRALVVPLGGFRQAHEAASAVLAHTVLEWSGLATTAPGTASAEAAAAARPGDARRVLELFAGHGNFTLPLAARAGSVVAVEKNAPASAALAENLAAHGLAADVVTEDASTALVRRKRALSGVDVVVLDPPRVGARECLEPLAALRPSTIVYVSCDPRTLARDAAALAGLGYALERVRAVSCFPRTAHVEAVARFVRAPGAASGRPTGR